MKSEWQQVTLQNVTLKIGDGLHGTPKYDNNGNYYFINGNNLKNGKIVIKPDTKRTTKAEYEKHGKGLTDKTLLLSINGTLGNIGIYNNEKCILGKSACYLNVAPEIDFDFVKYTLTNRQFQDYISIFAHGTTIKNVALQTIREYSFLLPPLPEQKAIASVLSSLDDKIDLLHRQNKTLEAMAETLFRQWFVEEADASWEEVTLGYFADNIRDNINTASLSDFDTYIGLEHIPRRRIYIDNTGQTDTLESNKSKFSYHDILFGKLRSYFHKVSFAHTHGVCSTDILVIRPKSKELFPFCLFWFFSDEVVAHSDAGAEGTRMPRSNWGIISNYKVPKPDNPTIERFNNVAIPAIKKIEDNASQIKTLEKLRDTLLPKLMSGEVRVKV